MILYELPVLHYEDNGNKALSLMRDFHIYHLPVVHKDDYIALISEDDILDWDTPDDTLSKAEFLNFRPAVFDHMHPIEAIKVVKEFSLSVLPVLDKDRHFIGCVTQENLFNYLTNTSTYEQEGGIIILSIDPIHFSLSEIARLTESNNVSLYGVLVHEVKSKNRLYITLKTNRTDLRALVATFERYDYEIVNVYNALESKEELKDNYDSFMRYLDI